MPKLKELLTPANLIALDKLACLLARLPDDYRGFDMSSFAVFRDGGDEIDPDLMDRTQCGTVCCAVGHLPYLGYAGHASCWNKYSYEITGLLAHFPHPAPANSTELMQLWRWCFSCSWGSAAHGGLSHGTARHAAKRIAFMLDHYDEYPAALDCYREGATAAKMGVEAMEKVGEKALLGQRRKVKLELFNPDLIQAIKA